MHLDQIIGHKTITDNFKTAIANGQIAHSYIFEGPKSTGKKTTAIAIAKTLLSQDIDVENQPDLVIVDKADKSIKVEDMEELQKDIITRPFKGDKKVYIICQAEKMTVQAQNKFLKTLEEPPLYTTIILITDNKQELLPTIISRCQLITFNYISTTIIEDLLIDNYNLTKEKAEFVSSFSNGLIGRAIALSQDQEFITLRENTIEAIDTTIMESKEKIFTTTDFFEKNKDNIEEILDIMLFYFRDLIIYVETGKQQYLINKDMMKYIEKHKNQLEKKALHDIIKIITDTKENINLKVSFSLNIEIMLLEIQEGKYGSCSGS